jgi:hypothetical protein
MIGKIESVRKMMASAYFGNVASARRKPDPHEQHLDRFSSLARATPNLMAERIQ